MRISTMTTKGLAAVLLAMLLALGACGDETTSDPADDTGTTTDVSSPTDTVAPADTATQEDTAVADTTPEDTAGPNPCEPNPCLNGGTCADDGAGSAACACVDGYTGDTCEIAPAVDPCDPNPCLNGATCADDGAGKAVCTCADGYEGDLCADVALKDIVDTAVAAGNFTTLVTAVEAAGLVDTLKGDGPFTVLAPTDDAFAALDPATLEAALADPNGLLTDVLTYHVVNAKAMAADVVGMTEIETLNGAIITVEVVNDEVILNGSVKVTTTDIACTNGVIHVIDAVLLPPQPKDIVDTAIEAGIFTTLVTAVVEAELVDTLKGEGPFTVLAPTDDAFAALEDGVLDSLLADPQGALTDILTYHVAAGKAMAADVVGLSAIETLNGKKITVEVVDGEVILNGSVKVTATDIECTNGVIHVIDAVLIPLDDIIETATAAGNFTTLLTAVEAAGFTETLMGDGPFTVLAPTDEAFEALDPATLQAALADPEGLLTDVLTYHVADGKFMAAQVLGLTEIPTLNGKVITVEIVDGTVVLNGVVKVIATDIECSNGVIHVIDAVLIPPVQLCETDMGPCDIGSEPNNGLVCVIGWGGQGMCRRTCTDLDLTNCIEGEGCISDEDTGAGFCGLIECNGLFTDDCGPGATCVVIDGNGTCYVAGDLPEGDACTGLFDCQMQLLCVGSECQAPPCSTDNIKTCPAEDEICQAYTLSGLPLDVGECLIPCMSFTDDPMCAENEWCSPFFMDALNGQCVEIEVDGGALGAACGAEAGDATCGADLICVAGICETLCKVEAGLGEVGGCGEMQLCLGLSTQAQGALDIGICSASCDYHGGVSCPSDDDYCAPKELVGESNDTCIAKPDFWPMEYGSACTPEMEYNFCAPGAFCYGGACTKACFISEAAFGADHPDCQDEGVPTECVDLGFGPSFGLCQ